MLGYLLRQPEFSRTAVIINEFGEIGLDHELIEASEDSVIELGLVVCVAKLAPTWRKPFRACCSGLTKVLLRRSIAS